MNDDIEDKLDKETVDTNKPEFELPTGRKTEDDPDGILDENLQIRRQLTRMLLSNEKAVYDPDIMNIAMKLMADNDRSILAKARIKADSDNANMVELAKEIVSAALVQASNVRKEKMAETIEHQTHAPEFELPPPSRKILDTELEESKGPMSEAEVTEKLKFIDELPMEAKEET